VTRARVFLIQLIPVAVLAAVYGRTFDIWFREDDFPLLEFVRRAHSFADFLKIAFVPYAQGTIRPWSERLPFFLSATFFGDDCYALRIAVFLTVCADLLLIQSLARRITGSLAAGCFAATLWVTSAALISPMTWNSSYNEVQYPVFLLGALLLLDQFDKTGKSRYWWLQFVVFVLGFGSLENMVVYPAIAVVWLFCFGDRARRRLIFRTTLPLFAISALYTLAHLHLAPLPREGLYEFRIDLRVFSALLEYGRWMLLSPEWGDLQYRRTFGLIVVWASALGLVASLVANAKRRRPTAWFSILWFLLTIGPLLALPNRRTEYYLTVPEIGLCVLAGSGLDLAWKRRAIWMAIPATFAALIWIAGMLSVVIPQTTVYLSESDLSRDFIPSVREARARRPNSPVFVENVTDTLYQVDFQQNATGALGIDRVYIAPGAMNEPHINPEDQRFKQLVPDAAVVRHALDAEDGVVYTWKGDHLQNITSEYSVRNVRASGTAPRRVRVGDPLYAYTLGSGWGAIGNGVRWMPGEAEVTMASPSDSTQVVSVSGYCVKEQFMKGPLHLTLYADGAFAGSYDIAGPETTFQRRFSLPSAVLHRDTMLLKISVSPPIVINGQNYAALFGDIELQDR